MWRLQGYLGAAPADRAPKIIRNLLDSPGVLARGGVRVAENP
jgi:hypothetical protein